MAFGTLTTLDTLAATQQSIAAYGEDNAFQAIDIAFAAHNRQLEDMMSRLVETTTDRQRRYGSAASKTMQVLDQLTRPDAQKVTAGVTLGFPLRQYGDALQWTRKFFQTEGSAKQIAAEVQAIMDADRRNVMYLIKQAAFNPTNYTFNDILIDNVALAVKRLVNADSAAIPLGPNGESFVASTHTHYLFTAAATLAAADLTALIATVIEHHATGQVKVFINQAQETAVRGLSGFVAYIDPRIIVAGGSTTNVASGSLDMMNPNDRAIGIYGAAEIIVKPWQQSGYLTATVEGAPPPIVMRERSPGSGNLVLTFDDETHPLRAQGYEREVGFAVFTRTNMAILFVDAGSAGAYVAPTLTN